MIPPQREPRVWTVNIEYPVETGLDVRKIKVEQCPDAVGRQRQPIRNRSSAAEVENGSGLSCQARVTPEMTRGKSFE